MNEQPTQIHEPISDATRVDLEPVQRVENDMLGDIGNWKPTGLLDDTAGIAASVKTPPPLAGGRRALRNGESMAFTTHTGHIEASAAAMARPGGEPLEAAPGPDYSDVEAGVLRSIETAQMLAELRVSGEQIDPAATEATVERIRALRLALGGVGQVGQHFNAVGSPVADQVAVILTGHEVESLIMRLTERVRFGTI